MTDNEIRAEIAVAQSQLNDYRAQEHKMLTDGVQSYGIGSRNLQRYQMSLTEVRTAIKETERKLAGLRGQLAGTGRRAARGVVPMDF